MQVQSTTHHTTVQEAQAQTSDVSKSSSLFDSLLSNATKPTDITYNEYKNLSVEDIANLYTKESMSDEYDKAIALHTSAHFSDDEILNQVLFDKELDSYGSEVQNFVSRKIESLGRFWDLLKEPLEISEKTTELMNIPKNTEPIDKETLAQIAADKKRWDNWRKEDKPPADFLFNVFANNRMDFEQNREYYKNSESTFRKHGQEILAIYDSIQSEYEKRVSEQKSALNNYTKNNKPNALQA